MKLGIFGDSFAAKLNPNLSRTHTDLSWMELVKEHLGCSMKIHALQGTSLWFSFEKFMQFHEKYSHIVVCYTGAERINYMPAHLASYSVIQEKDDIDKEHFTSNIAEELLTIATARKLLYNYDLDLFIYQQIFEKINELCFLKNIKLVNLTTTTHPLDLTNRKGDCLLDLSSISAGECKIVDIIGALPNDPRCCHMSKENNIVLADIIKESFLNENSSVIPLDKNTNFVFSKEISNRYVKR